MIGPPALLFGVPIADSTMTETVDLVDRFIGIGRRDGRTFQIATPNVDFLVQAGEQPDVHRILRNSDLNIADGAPIVWASRALGTPVRERVAGSDLVPRLVERSEMTGAKVHVFGSTPDVADRALAMMSERHPAARFTFDPGPVIADPADVDDEVLSSIVAVDADVLCVALGNPKQERFIAAHRERLGVPVLIGVGGSLDMLTGERRRAPGWMQRAGLEWLFRAAQEPGRLGPRYAADVRVFGPRLARELRAARARRDDGGVQLESDPDVVRIVLGPSDDPARADYDRAVGHLDGGATVRVAVTDDAALSDIAASALIGLLQRARWHGQAVDWPDTGERFTRACAALGIRPDEIAGS
ncbi:MAG: WecB/TagA/CpsF family glycosyltransferase [Ilumatobacter sp.]|nr:WecB/TagA/CpsF family glycosyltransferase [Ilumatobacter sp.]